MGISKIEDMPCVNLAPYIETETPIKNKTIVL
jgi:hypothetical protein